MTESPNNPTPQQLNNSQDNKPVFPGINTDKVEFFSNFTNAVWATAGSIFLLILTQLITYCGNAQLESKKRESELIKQALSPDNKEQAEQNLIFLVRSRLVDCDQFRTIEESLLYSKQTPDIAVDSYRFNHYYIPKADTNGYKVEFSEKEKNCRIIRALLTTTPFSFGNKDLPTNSFQSKYDKAVGFQNQGFRYLLSQELDEAKKSFESAYKNYETLYNIDEINKLLKSTKKDFKWGEDIYCPIVKDYSWGMPNEIKTKMKMQGKCN